MASSGEWCPQPPRISLEQDLVGKVAVVTGATKGIGRAIALNLASRGANILGTCSSPESLHHFDTLSINVKNLYDPELHSSAAKLSQIEALHCPKIVGIIADITIPTAPTTILDALQSNFKGKVDIVVFNAAVMGLARMGEGAVSETFVNRALEGNVAFPIMLVEALVSKECFKSGGRVVAVSSEGVRVRRPGGGAVYAATKAALECLMRKWADELGARPGMEGTTFNSVSVGFTKTDAYYRIPLDTREKLMTADAVEVAVGNRIGEAEDVADVVGMLVSENARWISGSVVDATGGKAKIL
ncbi:short-chain dehydrogenase [Zopfia rhizophila CBS 207.26]|uniref:Short-chain dehydrogenase n=1 Tax=Zopfia rhizophila CBS 207.26 TaxID=1314779 RepID=A0A6A6E2L0_9PEZI|nr:short-chain dehydrogenase [Zopfia rhizophila CBS 207.26]